MNKSAFNTNQIKKILQGSELWKEGQPLRLHLGCGEQHLGGYINIDYPPSEHNVMNIKADLYTDIRQLEFPTETVDEIRLHHVFEHFNRVTALAMLIKWHKFLRVGGKLHIETPDLEGSAKTILSDASRKIKMGVVRHIAGDQTESWAYHIDHWFPERFEYTLQKLGFTDIQINCSSWPHEPYLSNVEVIAIKSRPLSLEEQLKNTDELLWESTVSDVEKPMYEIWKKQIRSIFKDNIFVQPNNSRASDSFLEDGLWNKWEEINKRLRDTEKELYEVKQKAEEYLFNSEDALKKAEEVTLKLIATEQRLIEVLNSRTYLLGLLFRDAAKSKRKFLLFPFRFIWFFIPDSFKKIIKDRDFYKKFIEFIFPERLADYPEKYEALEVRFNNIVMEIPKDMEWCFSEGDFYEKNLIHYFEKIIKSLKSPVLYDIGANYGYYSLRFSDLSSMIYAFEPVSRAYAVIKRNIEINKLTNVIPFKFGVFNKKCNTKINLYSSSGNNSIFKRTIPDEHPLKYIGKETVKCIVLDKFVREKRLQPPDLIKIDVEGAELHVLQGAKDIITKHRPFIIIEYSENTCQDAGYAKEDLIEELLHYKYTLYGLSEEMNDFKLYIFEEFNKVKLANIIAIPEGVIF